MKIKQEELFEYLKYLYYYYRENECLPRDEDALNEERLIALNISRAIYERRYQDAVSALKPLDAEKQRLVRNFFNKTTLIERKLEWTGHGINRTFRFWSSAQKIEYLKFAMSVVDVISSRYKATLGYGSVLSIVRDKDLIPHDDDLDIIVACSAAEVVSYNNELNKLEKYLKDNGFKTRGDYVAHRHVSNGKYMVDVFLGMEEGEYVSWHPGPRKVLRTEDVFPSSITNLYGIDCYIPRRSEKYLSVVYGKNWRTPISGWSHDFDPSRYSDWFWPRTGAGR